MPGLSVSSRAPRWKIASRSCCGMPRPSSSTMMSTTSSLRLDRHEDAAAAIFGGIFDEIADHLVEVLPLDPDLRVLVAGDVDGDVLVQPVDGALHRLDAFPDAGARMGRSAAADRPGAREMMVDLAPHDRRLAADRVGKVGRVGGRGIGDDRQRSLQRMGEVAGVAARFLGLLLAVGEQLVDLLGQRLDLVRESPPAMRVFAPERIAATSCRTRRSGQRP